MSLTIAIDGPAASGKGTLAKRLAEHFGLGHLDTGLLYRATGRRVLDGESPVEAARNLRREDLDRDGLRAPDVGRAASEVAALGQVRSALVDFQRAFAARAGGAVLDGRDIGTVICPDAPIKLFITADLETRARRRFTELVGRGQEVSIEDVRDDLVARDNRDQGRADAPLKPAADAVLLDTSDLSIDDAVARAIEIVDARRG